MRALLVTMLLGTTLVVTGCGGDNLELCDGCGAPTPTPTLTSTAPTPTGPTPTGPTPTGPTPTAIRTRSAL